MGLVQAEVTLINANDLGDFRRGQIKEHEIRQTTVMALVDSGAWTMVISEAIREKLGLEVVGSDYATLADGNDYPCKLAGPLEVKWKDRRVLLEALVLPSGYDALLGAIPLEAMDLIIDPRGEELIGAHGDRVVHILFQIQKSKLVA